MTKIIVCIMSLIVGIETIVTARNDVPSKIPFYILNAASKYDIDVDLMYAICLTESKCKARAVNHNDGTKAEKAAGIIKKAYGLFQIQLDTATALGFVKDEVVTVTKKRGHRIIVVNKTIDHTKDLLKPEVNALYAAKLLHKLYLKYGDTKKVVSAYNAGHYTRTNSDYVNIVFAHYVKLKIDRRF